MSGRGAGGAEGSRPSVDALPAGRARAPVRCCPEPTQPSLADGGRHCRHLRSALEAAQSHFETALKQAHELPHKIAQPEVRRWYARMLLDRNTPGDRDKARILLGEATEMYRTIGMPKHLEMVAKMTAELSWLAVVARR